MRIIIDARLYGIENAGLGRYTQKLIEHLQQVDSQNQYFLLMRSKNIKIELAPNFTAIECDIAHYTINEQIKLPKLVKSLQPDLVHFPHFNVPYNFKFPYVVTIHDMLMHKFKGRETTTQPFLKYAFKRFGYKKVFNSAVVNARGIIVPTNYVKEDLIRFFHKSPRQIYVTYEGIDPFPKQALSADVVLKKYNIDKPYFIYFGNAYPHKNIARAIEAMVYLNEDLKTECIFLISSARNVFSERIEKLIQQQKASNYVRYAGFIPDEELSVLMKKSVGFFYPSLEEGFGLQGLEAMENTTLLIASEIPVFKEVYKDNAIYFNPFDFTAMAMSLKLAIDLPIANRKVRLTKAKEFIKKYSWEKMAKETLNVYKEAASNA